MTWRRSRTFLVYRFLGAVALAACSFAALVPLFTTDFDAGLPPALAILTTTAAVVLTVTTVIGRRPGPYRVPLLHLLGPFLAGTLAAFYIAEALGWPTTEGVRAVRTVGIAWLAYAGIYHPLWSARALAAATIQAVHEIERVSEHTVAAIAGLRSDVPTTA